MRSVRARVGTAVVALGLMATATACQSNVGAAATVDGHSIAETDVTKYVNTTGTTAGTRAFIVNYLVKQKLFERALAKKGVAVNEPELRSLEVNALQSVLGVQVTTSQQADASIATGLQTLGAKADFAPVVVRGAELEYAFIVAAKITDIGSLSKATRALNIPISVSPRYGSWDAAQLELGKVPNPDFLTTSPSPTASPAS